jgi:hypothetical protein
LPQRIDHHKVTQAIEATTTTTNCCLLQDSYHTDQTTGMCDLSLVTTAIYTGPQYKLVEEFNSKYIGHYNMAQKRP